MEETDKIQKSTNPRKGKVLIGLWLHKSEVDCLEWSLKQVADVQSNMNLLEIIRTVKKRGDLVKV